MTIWTENANRFASRDRAAHADALLDVACREVTAAYQLHRRLDIDTTGLNEAAASALEQAALKAERILG